VTVVATMTQKRKRREKNNFLFGEIKIEIKIK
jgi:hypothetical protein